MVRLPKLQFAPGIHVIPEVEILLSTNVGGGGGCDMSVQSARVLGPPRIEALNDGQFVCASSTIIRATEEGDGGSICAECSVSVGSVIPSWIPKALSARFISNTGSFVLGQATGFLIGRLAYVLSSDYEKWATSEGRATEREAVHEALPEEASEE